MAGIAGAELAPRDVVARAIATRTSRGEAVFLDARRLDVARRFPTVAALCRAAGLDPAVQPIPVRPAAHYHMGGVRVDGRGRSSLPGLWACGEVAATGLHGANRLASNSLLEAMAFAPGIAADIQATAPAGIGRVSGPLPCSRPDALPEIRTLMEAEVGLVRHEAGLARAVRRLAALAQAGSAEAVAGLLVAAAALERRRAAAPIGGPTIRNSASRGTPRSPCPQALSVADAAPRPALLQDVP